MQEVLYQKKEKKKLTKKSKGGGNMGDASAIVSPPSGLSVALVLRMLFQAAAGVSHLHAAGVVHRDLALRNFLVHENWRVCVTDFGFGKVVSPAQVSASASSDSDHLVVQSAGAPSGSETMTLVGPVAWEAPECWAIPKRFSTASDVWSFATCVYEALSGGPPWEGVAVVRVPMLVESGSRLVLPSYASAAVSALCKRCWQSDPSLRPKMAQVVALFKEESEALKQQERQEQEQQQQEQQQQQQQEDYQEIGFEFDIAEESMYSALDASAFD